MDLIDENQACVPRSGDQQLSVHGRHLLTVDDCNAHLSTGVVGLGVLRLSQ